MKLLRGEKIKLRNKILEFKNSDLSAEGVSGKIKKVKIGKSDNLIGETIVKHINVEDDKDYHVDFRDNISSKIANSKKILKLLAING